MSHPAGHVVVWSAVILFLLLGPSAGAVPLDRIHPSEPPAASAAPYRALPEPLVLDTLPSFPGPAAAATGGHPVPLHAAKGPSIVDSSKPFVVSLPGAEIGKLELPACASPTCDWVEITFTGEEPPLRTPRIEGRIKFQPPADDSNSREADSGPARWLDWLDNLTEAKSDAGYPSLVLGASGILGIWLARLKRPRPM